MTKIRIVTLGGCTTDFDVPDNPEKPFNFMSFCMEIQSLGGFRMDNLFIPYGNITHILKNPQDGTPLMHMAKPGGMVQ